MKQYSQLQRRNVKKKHIYCCFFTTRLTFSKQNTVYVKTFLFICID